MIKARSPYIWRQTTESPLYLADFGGVANGQSFTNGTTNHATATDNSLPIKAWLQAGATSKRECVLLPGNWMYKQGNIIQLANASGVRLRGAHEDSNLMYVNPLNQSGIILGSATSGVNCVGAQESPITLAAGTTTASRVLTLATTTPGETPTQRLLRGMQLYLADESQPLAYRAATFNPAIIGTIAYYKGTFATVEEVISDTEIEVSGVTEWDFNADTKVGYWPFPNENVVVETLRFTYDRLNSFQGGASSALVLVNCLRPKTYNLTAKDNPSRAFAWRNSINQDLDTVIGVDTVNEKGSLMTATGTGHSMFRNVISDHGTHGYDEGGDPWAPSLHNTVDTMRCRGFGGGVGGSHKSSGHLTLRSLKIIGQFPTWNEDDDPDTDEADGGSAVTLRGQWPTLDGLEVSKAAIALRIHKTSGASVRRVRSIECGRTILDDDNDFLSVIDVEARDPLWWALDIRAATGPSQNHTLISNKVYDDIRTVGRLPSQGDAYVYTGPQYNVEERFRRGGWSFTRCNRNGAPFVVIGAGTALDKFPLFLTSPNTELASQLVGPAYSMTTQTGAIAATVDGTGSVTSNYQGGELLEVPGGTLAAGGA